MAKYKNYNYSQKILIPVSLEEQILPETLEFAIHTLIETGMDLFQRLEMVFIGQKIYLLPEETKEPNELRKHSHNIPLLIEQKDSHH